MSSAEVILTYPNPLLRRVALPVAEITPEIASRARAMFQVMTDDHGIGLAAPQIGWNIRLFVVNVTGKPDGNIAFVNPEIIERHGRATAEEGCLSVPGIFAKVERPKRIVIAGLDLEGKAQELQVEDLMARCLLHEYDHLDGLLFIDRVSPIHQRRIKKQLKELEDAWREATEKNLAHQS